MRSYLCWNCGKLCECPKEFPNGRPKRRSECAEYIDAPPEAQRITHREMANILGCPERKIKELVSTMKGVKFLTNALAKKGITITYERTKNRIYFYREENKDV